MIEHYLTHFCDDFNVFYEYGTMYFGRTWTCEPDSRDLSQYETYKQYCEDGSVLGYFKPEES